MRRCGNTVFASFGGGLACSGRLFGVVTSRISLDWCWWEWFPSSRIGNPNGARRAVALSSTLSWCGASPETKSACVGSAIHVVPDGQSFLLPPTVGVAPRQ
jgi:hypothetical protein